MNKPILFFYSIVAVFVGLMVLRTGLISDNSARVPDPIAYVIWEGEKTHEKGFLSVLKVVIQQTDVRTFRFQVTVRNETGTAHPVLVQINAEGGMFLTHFISYSTASTKLPPHETRTVEGEFEFQSLPCTIDLSVSDSLLTAAVPAGYAGMTFFQTQFQLPLEDELKVKENPAVEEEGAKPE